jgi:hypothetical protein
VYIYHRETLPVLLSFLLSPRPFPVPSHMSDKDSLFFLCFPIHGPFSRRYVGLDIPETVSDHIEAWPDLAALAEFDLMIPYLVVQEWIQTELKQIKVQQPKKSSQVTQTRTSAVLVSLRSLYYVVAYFSAPLYHVHPATSRWYKAPSEQRSPIYSRPGVICAYQPKNYTMTPFVNCLVLLTFCFLCNGSDNWHSLKNKGTISR